MMVGMDGGIGVNLNWLTIVRVRTLGFGIKTSPTMFGSLSLTPVLMLKSVTSKPLRELRPGC